MSKQCSWVGRLGAWLGALSIASAGCGGREEKVAVDLGPQAFAPQALGSLNAAEHARKEFNPRLLRRFQPVRPLLVTEGTASPSPALVELGRALYFDKRLSKNGSQSCNSCHPLDRYGADGEKTSAGHSGKRGQRNSPTVYHAAGSFAQFWDGRAIDVEEQAKGPIMNPVEMGMKDGVQLEQVLRAVPGYVTAFRHAYPKDKQPVSYAHVTQAIGAFERGLVTLRAGTSICQVTQLR
jgi:cytochrome c peroxidase